MGDDYELIGPEDLGLFGWVVVAIFAPLVHYLLITDREMPDSHLNYRLGRVVAGLTFCWIAVVYHALAYPVVITYPLEVLQTILLTLWNAIPTIYWAPWHVSSVASVAGVGLVASGFWGGEPDD